MQYEFDHGVPVIQAEAVLGAVRFAAGAGRGGKFWDFISRERMELDSGDETQKIKYHQKLCSQSNKLHDNCDVTFIHLWLFVFLDYFLK